MFTYNDYLKIFEYLKNGTISDLDPNTLILALSEQVKSKNFIENTIDQVAFGTDDYKRLKKFLIDWYASHRTIVSTQKDASDLYSIPESHLNELFYSFGFDIGEALKNLPLSNKIIFFYDLVNLYKVKGTPYSIFKIFNYFNIPSIEICEYWLQKNSLGSLIFNGRPIFTTPGVVSLGDSSVDFNVVLSDPHWFLTEVQINSLFLTNKIRFPSKSPYFGIRPTYDVGNTLCLESYLSRKTQDDYNTWFTGGTLNRDIRCSLGLDISYLELYLGCIYIFKIFYNPSGYNTGSFLCYDGTSLPSYELVAEVYQTLIQRPLSRDEIKTSRILFSNTFSRLISENFLNGYTDSGTILNLINPILKNEIDSYIVSNKELDCISLLFQDLSTWIKNNIGVDESSFPSFVLDFSSFSSWYIDKVVNFFKPYRSRLLLVENIYNLGNPVEDSVISDDYLTTDIPMTVTEEIIDYDTADSSPSFYNDSTSFDYYSREHFDSDSYFDIGASIDIDPFIGVEDIIEDILNSHPSDSTSYIHFDYTLDSSSNVIYASQDGGFVNYDEGGYYDSPFMSDICQIYMIESSLYSDIVFWHGCESLGGELIVRDPEDYVHPLIPSWIGGFSALLADDLTIYKVGNSSFKFPLSTFSNNTIGVTYTGLSINATKGKIGFWIRGDSTFNLGSYPGRVHYIMLDELGHSLSITYGFYSGYGGMFRVYAHYTGGTYQIAYYCLPIPSNLWIWAEITWDSTIPNGWGLVMKFNEIVLIPYNGLITAPCPLSGGIATRVGLWGYSPTSCDTLLMSMDNIIQTTDPNRDLNLLRFVNLCPR